MSTKLNEHSRWAAWEDQVLSKCKNPKRLQRVIGERQKEMDDDDHEREVIRDLITRNIRMTSRDPDTSIVFIPTRVLNDWLEKATPHRPGITKVTPYLKRLNIAELTYKREKSCGGWEWTGIKAKKGTKRFNFGTYGG